MNIVWHNFDKFADQERKEDKSYDCLEKFEMVLGNASNKRVLDELINT